MRECAKEKAMKKLFTYVLAFVLLSVAYVNTVRAEAGIVPNDVTDLIAAKKILEKAQTDYNEFVAEKRAAFEASSEFVAAKTAVEDDERALAAAKAPLQEKLKATDKSYASAMNGIEEARKKLEEAMASKKIDDIAFRRHEVNRMQETIRKAEESFAKAPTVVAAQTKLTASQLTFATMQQKCREHLENDGDVRALWSAWRNAQRRVDALTKTTP